MDKERNLFWMSGFIVLYNVILMAYLDITKVDLIPSWTIARFMIGFGNLILIIIQSTIFLNGDQ